MIQSLSHRRRFASAGRRRVGIAAASIILLGAPLAPVEAQVAPPPSYPRIEVVEPAPGAAGALVASVLSRPYRLLAPSERGRVELPRDFLADSSLVVVGSDLMLAGTVHGDVLVMGGGLFLRPGVGVDGRAIAVGGGVYPTTLGHVDGGRIAIREGTFDSRLAGDVMELRYRRLRRDYRDWFTLPGLKGLRLVGYDRVDGVVVPYGPRLIVGADRSLTLDPVLTWRTDLGLVDPSLTANWAASPSTSLIAVAERGTYTNDAWARSDLVNSAATFFLGSDARNYWRSTRGALTARRTLPDDGHVSDLSLTAQWEDDRSVGPVPGSRSGPWAVFGANDDDRILRPNPRIAEGKLVSGIGEAGLRWEGDAVMATGRVKVEVPVSTPDDSRWAQATLDGAVTIPTFGFQQLSVTAHALLTAGDAAPAQRFAYLGGSATLPTADPLVYGGDELFFLDATYSVPLPGPMLPIVGPPVVALRYAIGSAGVQGMPPLVQNVGVGLGVSFFRVDFMLNPSNGHTAVGGTFVVPAF